MKMFARMILVSMLLLLTLPMFSIGMMFFSNDTTRLFALEDYDVDIRIENQAAVTTVTETFRNSTFFTTNPIYAFGMPLDASAVRLYYTIGDTTWSASLQGGEQSQNPGQGTGYGEDINNYLGDNPLVMPFEDTVLESGDTIIIELEYVNLLHYENGNVSYIYPSSPFQFHNNPIPHGNITIDIYSDRSIIDVNILDGICTPETTEQTNYAQIIWDEIDISSQNETSITYSLNTEELGMFGMSTLMPQDSVPDDDDNGFFLFIAEPDPEDQGLVIPKMFTLIIDNSGSMSGSKINQAKEAARYIVNSLNEDDKFNLVKFNSSAQSWQQTMQDATQSNINSAISYINAIYAGGGTNISGAFSTAIPIFNDPDNEFAKIVIFLTDGEATVGITPTESLVNHVNNEIEQVSNQICLYTFGIGESVNTSLLTQIARDNNGFPAFLGDDVLEEVITEFYNKVRNPILINPTVTVEPNVLSNIFPSPLNSIYSGSQLMISGRYSNPGLITVNLSGTAFGQEVTYNYDYTLSNQVNSDYAFLSKVWAKQMIENMIYEYYLLNPNSTEAEEMMDEIIDISIAWGVMCEFTHFIDDGDVGIDEEFAIQTPCLNARLLGNFPNPFNPSTTIMFEILSNLGDSAVIKIYNIRGELVKILVVNVQGKGIYEVNWNGTDRNLKSCASGTYFYTISVGDNVLSSKMVLLK